MLKISGSFTFFADTTAILLHNKQEPNYNIPAVLTLGKLITLICSLSIFGLCRLRFPYSCTPHFRQHKILMVWKWSVLSKNSHLKITIPLSTLINDCLIYNGCKMFNHLKIKFEINFRN